MHLSDSDPWLPSEPGWFAAAEAHEEPAAPEARKEGPGYEHGWGPVARVSATGEVTYDDASWQVPGSRDGYELAAYDLAMLAPGLDALAPALHGSEDEIRRASADPTTWWHGIIEGIAQAVGRDRWPASQTMLAWDPDGEALFVRQDEVGHRRVEEFLVPLAAGRLEAVNLRVDWKRTRRGETSGALSLDVPWGASVRAHRGATWSYVQDFDVEVSQTAFIADPIVAGVDTGFAVSARRVHGGEAGGDLHVEVAYAAEAPHFEPFRTALATGPMSTYPVTIESAWLRGARWKGRLPSVRGTHPIRLDDGSEVLLTVEGVRGGPSVARPVPRQVLPLPARGEDEVRREPEAFRLTWEDPDGSRPLSWEMPLLPRKPFVDSPLRVGGTTVDLRQATVAPLNGWGMWPPAEGGLRVRARVLRLPGVDVVDLVVERAQPADEVRTLDRTSHTDPPRVERVSLPVCPVQVDSRRVLLPVGGEARVRLRLGDGREGSLTVTDAAGR